MEAGDAHDQRHVQRRTAPPLYADRDAGMQLGVRRSSAEGAVERHGHVGPKAPPLSSTRPSRHGVH
jgi:hypothetical protein